MIGSPTSDSAQCATCMAASSRAGMTPGTPRHSLIISWCFSIAAFTRNSGLSVSHRHSRPTGFLWCRQQKTHLLAQARLGVASMHW